MSSELIKEIEGSTRTIASIEFFGRTFQERRQALSKVDHFRERARLELADSVSKLVGSQVCMLFRPSTTHSQTTYSRFTIPCYSIGDQVREPIERVVTIEDINYRTDIVKVGAGEIVNSEFDRRWWVGLGDIIDITPVEVSSD